MNISRISRIALLSVVFAAPVFAEESVTPSTSTQQQTEDSAKVAAEAKAKAEKESADAKAKAEAPKTSDADDKKAEASKTSDAGDKKAEAATTETSFVDKAKNFASAPFVFILATAPDKIADVSYLNTALVKLSECSMFNKDGFFQKYAKNGKIGRGIVLAATAAAIAAVVYSKLMAESVDMDSEDDQDFFEMNEAANADNQ